MIYTIEFENQNHKAGSEIELTPAFFQAIANEGRQHMGTMIDLVAERTGVTRGDASHIVYSWFDGLGQEPDCRCEDCRQMETN